MTDQTNGTNSINRSRCYRVNVNWGDTQSPNKSATIHINNTYVYYGKIPQLHNNMTAENPFLHQSELHNIIILNFKVNRNGCQYVDAHRQWNCR